LYLITTLTRQRWSQGYSGNISHADDNWPQIKDKTPKELEYSVEQ